MSGGDASAPVVPRQPSSRDIGWRGALLLVAGAALVALAGAADSAWLGPQLIDRLRAPAEQAVQALGGHGVAVSFVDTSGALTRHPTLVGGAQIGHAQKLALAQAVAASPGVAGVHWQRMGRAEPETASAQDSKLACQSRVEAILRSRSIRFAEASAAIDPTSRSLLDEVASALRPCVGSVVAIVGHTDNRGAPAANLALSRERAVAVRNALVARGINAAGLRAKGLGDEDPLPGLDPADPANRRIAFTVIAPVSYEPTPIDAPLAGPDGSIAAARGLPLWLEIQIVLGLTYLGGITIGWMVWGQRLARRA